MLKENIYVVYRVVAPGRKIPVGELEERRRAERKDNVEGLLRLARKRYSSSTFEALELTVEPAHRVAPVTPGGGEQR